MLEILSAFVTGLFLLKLAGIVISWWALGIFALWAQFRMDGTPSSREMAARKRMTQPNHWTRLDVAYMMIFGLICGPVYLVVTTGVFLAWIIRPGTKAGAWFEKTL